MLMIWFDTRQICCFYIILQDKKTALFWAADRGLIDILEAILECNPNTELANKVGNEPTTHNGYKRSLVHLPVKEWFGSSSFKL